jgi:hypothetical protein
VDWSQIRAEYERHRHGMFPEPGGYQARSFEQQWLAHFDGRGVSVTPDEGAWTWGFELVGVNGHARVTIDVNRITYHRSQDLDEWFVNDTRGLEHGFTLRSPREIRLAVRGELRARLAGETVEFLDAEGTAQMKYSGLVAWDAEGRKLPARMKVEDGLLKLAVDDCGARYPLTIDPIARQAYLKASNTGANDTFGVSVGVAGDTVVVGAVGEASGATGVNGNQADNTVGQSGAAYVFVRNGGTWTQQAYLKASNTGDSDNFGQSVGVSGNTVVVGAWGESSAASGVNGNQADDSVGGSGAAYVFVRSGTTWTQQAYLKASNPVWPALSFGYSVGVSGDTVVVGADGEASGATGVNGNPDLTAWNSGAAYVFVRSGGTWTQQAYLKASNTGSGDNFGISVGVSGNTVVVGAAWEDSAATGVNGNQADNTAASSGAAYVFARSGTTWTQQAYLKASNAGAGDSFGLSVGLSEDTVVVGAYAERSAATGVNGNQADNTAAGSGAAYVFVRSGSTWAQQAYLKASNTGIGEYFGLAVGVSGDTVVVGAYFESSAATGVNGNQSDNSAGVSGAAYVFVRNGTTWNQLAYLKASNTGAFDNFGRSVGVSANTVVVGAYYEASATTGVNGDQTDNTAFQSGAAYVFAVPPMPTAVFRDSNGGIQLTSYSSNTLQNAGGVFASNPGFAQNAAGHSFVVARDNFNGLWLNTFQSQSWTGWQFAGGVVQGEPAIAAIGGSSYFMARDNYNAYWIRKYTPGSGFGAWINLGGVFATDPVIAASGTCCDYYVAGRDNFGAIWIGTFNGNTDTFSGFISGGAVAVGKPSLTKGADGAAYIAIRDGSNAVWMGRFSSIWDAWQPAGGVIANDPQTAAIGSDVRLVALTSTGAVWNNVQGVGNNWQGWTTPGGVLTDVVIAGANPPQFNLVGRDTGNALWWHDSVAGWSYLGNPGLAAGPLAAAPR